MTSMEMELRVSVVGLEIKESSDNLWQAAFGIKESSVGLGLGLACQGGAPIGFGAFSCETSFGDESTVQ
jgi:hypothetical protein